MRKPLFETHLRSLELLSRGKVRDIYAIDDGHLLFVASDRLSAFDVVLPDPIPGKGEVLTDLSVFWFQRLRELVPNHLTPIAVEDVLSGDELAMVRGQALVVRRLQTLPVEAVARGYIIGSGWKDYQASGAVSGITLPRGLRQAQQLSETLFTPADKAEVGMHDENITFDDVVNRVGRETADRIRDLTVRIYEHARAYARERGIIIADTKFEFGLDRDGTLVLIDEVLTPDSSRFWPVEAYREGISPPSFDKQIVRDYLETLDWDKTPPGPRLPAAVIEKTSQMYARARALLTGT
jgi:phosphoribosylaminoimidazole-succinocarboxamide synthase